MFFHAKTEKGTPETNTRNVFLLCFGGFLDVVVWVNLPKCWTTWVQNSLFRDGHNQVQTPSASTRFFPQEIAAQVTRKYKCACFMSEMPSDPTKIIVYSFEFD